MFNSPRKENENNQNYLILKTEPNFSSKKGAQYFSEGEIDKKRLYNNLKLEKTASQKNNEKFINTGNNIFNIYNKTSYSRRNKRKNHIIKLKNNMLFNRNIPGCSPYDPYLIKVCKKAIINRKDQLPNYIDVIKKINTEFGIEEDYNYRGLSHNNKLIKAFNTFNEFKNIHTKGSDIMNKKSIINSEVKVFNNLEKNQK